MAKQLMLPANRAFNSNGLAIPGATASLYLSGTLTPANFYADSGLVTSLGPTLTANGAGRFDINAYGDETVAYRLITKDALGAQLDDIDPFYFGSSIWGTLTAASGVSVGSRALLAAVASPANGQSATLTESGREGAFVFSTANLSASVTSDPQQGILVAPASDTTGASGAWVRKFTGPISAAWFGAKGDGATDDSAAVTACLTYAFANGKSVDGAGLVYAVSGTLQFTGITRPRIRALRLKQLTPAVDRKTLYLLNCQNIRIEQLEVDVGTSATSGYMNSSGGLWIDGGSKHNIANVEVFGSGQNSLIAILNTTESYYSKLVARDGVFDNAAATDDVLQGIFLATNTDCTLDQPVVYNLTGNALLGGVANVNLRTRGIVLGGNSRIRVIAPRVDHVDQGIDITGGPAVNANCSVHGGGSAYCVSAGLKLANTAVRSVINGFTSEKCGSHGILISGPSGGGLPDRTADIEVSDCLALDIGYNAMTGTRVGFSVEAGIADTNFPNGVRFKNCRAKDTQAVKTMNYGFYSNVVYDPTLLNPNEIINCRSEGHVVGSDIGFHRPVCHVLGSGSVTTSSNVNLLLPWSTEIEDTMLMHSTVSATDVILIRIAGRYRVRAKLHWLPNSTGARRLQLFKNGGSVVVSAYQAAPNGEITTTALEEFVDCALGDSLQIYGMQLSGGALDIDLASSYFRVELVKAA